MISNAENSGTGYSDKRRFNCPGLHRSRYSDAEAWVYCSFFFLFMRPKNNGAHSYLDGSLYYIFITKEVLWIIIITRVFSSVFFSIPTSGLKKGWDSDTYNGIITWCCWCSFYSFISVSLSRFLTTQEEIQRPIIYRWSSWFLIHMWEWKQWEIKNLPVVIVRST